MPVCRFASVADPPGTDDVTVVSPYTGPNPRALYTVEITTAAAGGDTFRWWRDGTRSAGGDAHPDHPRADPRRRCSGPLRLAHGTPHRRPLEHLCARRPGCGPVPECRPLPGGRRTGRVHRRQRWRRIRGTRRRANLRSRRRHRGDLPGRLAGACALSHQQPQRSEGRRPTSAVPPGRGRAARRPADRVHGEDEQQHLLPRADPRQDPVLDERRRGSARGPARRPGPRAVDSEGLPRGGALHGRDVHCRAGAPEADCAQGPGAGRGAERSGSRAGRGGGTGRRRPG